MNDFDAKEKGITNKDLGFDDFFKVQQTDLILEGVSVARIVAEHKGAYDVRNEQGIYRAKITGKHIFQARSREDYPVVGDWVEIVCVDTMHAIIQRVFPRKTLIKRNYTNANETHIIAANIDVVFVVQAVDRDYNLNRFDRYCALARDGGARAALIVNKIDLISSDALEIILRHIHERFPEVPVFVVSSYSDIGITAVQNYIQAGKTYCFLGSSGVGKSSLINQLLGEMHIKTKEISTYSGRGKHTTTTRELYVLDTGGVVIDNPGIRQVGMTDAQTGIDTLFETIAQYALRCKYTNCTHVHEPECYVRARVDSGALDKQQYTNYINLKKEANFYEMTEHEKRIKNKQFGKFIKKAKKDIQRYKE